MKKRILSLALALAVLLVSLPLLPISASAEDGSAEDIAIADPGKPILEVDRVLNDFDGVPTTGTVTVGGIEYNVGIGTNTDSKADGDYSAKANNSNNTLTIENDALKSTLNADGKFGIIAWMSPVSPTRGNTFPSSETVALQFHIDLSGVTSVAAGTAVSFEPKFYLSTGRSSGAFGYCIPDETYIYIPDATEENPNPEAMICTTGGGVQVYHGSVNGYAGQSGTIIVPFDAYTTESLSQFSGGPTIWDLYKYTDGYRHRSYFVLDGYAKAFTAGESIVVDDICWMKKPAASEEVYDHVDVVEDFTSFVPNFNWTWKYGNMNGYSNSPDGAVNADEYSVVDGRLAVTPNDTAADWTRFTTTIDVANWDAKYEAFAFDIDLSTLIGNKGMRLDFTGYDAEGNYTSFGVFNGTITLQYEDGTINRLSMDEASTTTTQWSMPEGFKGTIYIPAAAVHNTSGTDIAITEDFAELNFVYEILGWQAADNGESVYVDNFAYCYSDAVAGDGIGTNFTELDDPYYETKAPITEDARTIEAYFKTESNFTQSIIATKFGDISYHPDMINVRITSTGQLVLQVGTAKVNVGNYALNDGKWHHVAVVVDEANSRVLAYVDGAVANVADLGTFSIGKNADYLPTTIGNFLPAESKYHTSFDGTIANVRMWSDARTAEELKANATKSVGADAEGLIAEWMLTGENFAKETTGKYDLQSFYWNIDAANELYAHYNRDAAEGEFTMLFIPDTQTIVKNFKGQENSLFDWIIANAERLNVKAVIALGDIVEYATDEDAWQRMSAQYNRLTEAGIPWVPTIGDHDWEDLYTDTCDNYDKYFTEEMIYQNEWFKLGGKKDEDSIVNAYFLADISEDVKFLIMNLEVLPLDSTLAWANEVIAAHPDYRVIVATHRNMRRAYCQRYTEISYNRGNAGEDVWQKLISQHKNIVAYMCGHSETSSYYANYDEGINGNKVLQVVCDLQNTDQSYKTLQAILVARFTENATKVQMGVYGARPDVFINTTTSDLIWDLSDPADILEQPIAGKYYDGPDFKVLYSKDANSFPSTAGGYVNAATATGAGVNPEYYAYKGGNIEYTWDSAREAGKFVATGACNADGHIYVIAKTRPDADTNMITFHMDATGVEGTNGIFKGQLVFAFNKATGHTVKAGSEIYFVEDGSTEVQVIKIPKSGSTTSSWNHYISFKAGVSGTYYIPTERFGPTTAAQSGYEATYEGTNWINVTDLSTTSKVANWRFNTDGSNYKYNYLQLRQITLAEGDEIYIDNLTYTKVASYGNEFTVTFKDAFGNVIADVDALENKAVLTADIPAAPERMGYKFIGWSADLTLPVVDDMVVTALYEKDVDTTYEVGADTSVENNAKVEITLPENQDKAYYNDRVTITTSEYNEAGQIFSHWVVNGSVFSYKQTISFLVFDELNIEAVYVDERPEEEPTVIYTNPSANYVLNGTKWNLQVMGVVNAPEGKEVTEIGILLSASEMTAAELLAGYDANDGTVFKMAAASASNGRQFLYTVKNIALDRTRCATVYAIVDGQLVVGDAVTCITIDANGAIVE